MQAMVKRYLSLCTFDEARHRLYTSFEAPCRTETVPITRALGRVLSAPLYAKYSVPEVNLAVSTLYIPYRTLIITTA